MCTQRKKKEVIGRLVTVNLTEGERYYLRLLLMNVRTLKSFDNIKTVNGNHTVTFREAAENLGLLSGDHIFDKCLDEAVLYQMPSSFRRLFATLLIFCDISNPRNLWNKFKSYMCEDLLRTRLHTDDGVQLMVLQLIVNAVEKMGKKIDDFNLVDNRLSMSTQEKEDREIASEYTIHDSAFCEYLMKIGDGTEQLVGRDKIKIPSSFIISCTDEDSSLDALFQSVYPDLTCFETDPYLLMNTTILTPKNEIANEINYILIDRFLGESKCYVSFD
nr:ATP-dependent DNA helicase RRM3-like [Ipomoea batatas]